MAKNNSLSDEWQFPNDSKYFPKSSGPSYPNKQINIDLSATFSDLNKKILNTNLKYTELNDKLAEFDNLSRSRLDDEIKSVQNKIDFQINTVKEKIDESKARVIETLALFAALFTFLSLQVQIMKDEHVITNIIGLILISGGLLTFFVLLLDLIMKSKSSTDLIQAFRFILLLIFSVSLIAFGLVEINFKIIN